MAEVLSASVKVAMSVSGSEAVRAAHKNVAKDMDSLSAAAIKAETSTDGLEKANRDLASVGIRTSQSVKQEIAGYEKLKQAHSGDAMVVAQLEARVRSLKEAHDATTQATQKQGQATHRSSLFLLNFSRGMEDLKFGLPAVINNFDSIGFSASLLTKEVGGARNAMKAIFSSLASPAGILAVLNTVYTAWVMIGDKLGSVKEEADAVKGAMESLITVSSGLFESVTLGLPEAQAKLGDLETKLDLLERQQQNMELAPRFVSAASIKAIDRYRKRIEMMTEALRDDVEGMEALEYAARASANEGLSPLANASGITASVVKELTETYSDLGIEVDTASQAFIEHVEALVELRKEQKNALETTAIESQFVGPVEFSIDGPAFTDPELDETLAAAREEEEKRRAAARKAAAKAREAALRREQRILDILDKQNTELAEQQALQHWAENRPGGPNVDPFEETSLDDIFGEDSAIETSLDAMIAKTGLLETSAMRVARAFKDGLKEEVEGTAIAIEQWPLDVVDAMSATIADSVMNLVTLQGSYKDLGQDVLQIMKQQVAQLAAMIIKRKALALLSKHEGISNFLGLGGAAAGAGAGGLLSGLAPLLLGVGALYGVASAVQSSHRGSQVGSFRGVQNYHPSMRLQVQSSVLPSGDIRFSANEAQNRYNRLGA